MRKIQPLALAVIFILAVCSCGDKKNIRPDWVDGKSPKKYPARRFMIGIGEGEDLAKAQDKARAEIAKQFSVRVEQLVQSMQDYTGMEGDKGSSWIQKTKISELTRTYTDETIQGIEIRETWRSPGGGNVRALAVIERLPASARLESRIMELDGEIQARVKQSRATGKKLSKIRPLVQSLELMKERAVRNNHLMVLSPVGTGTDAELSPAELDAELVRTLSELRIGVSVSGEGNEEVRRALVKSLTNGRLSVVPEGGETDILIRGGVKAIETNVGNTTEFIFAEYEAAIEMVDQADGKVFGLVEHSFRDGAKNLDDAKRKTLKRFTRKIVEDMNGKLYHYLSL